MLHQKVFFAGLKSFSLLEEAHFELDPLIPQIVPLQSEISELDSVTAIDNTTNFDVIWEMCKCTDNMCCYTPTILWKKTSFNSTMPALLSSRIFYHPYEKYYTFGFWADVDGIHYGDTSDIPPTTDVGGSTLHTQLGDKTGFLDAAATMWLKMPSNSKYVYKRQLISCGVCIPRDGKQHTVRLYGELYTNRVDENERQHIETKQIGNTTQTFVCELHSCDDTDHRVIFKEYLDNSVTPPVCTVAVLLYKNNGCVKNIKVFSNGGGQELQTVCVSTNERTVDRERSVEGHDVKGEYPSLPIGLLCKIPCTSTLTKIMVILDDECGNTVGSYEFTPKCKCQPSRDPFPPWS